MQSKVSWVSGAWNFEWKPALCAETAGSRLCTGMDYDGAAQEKVWAYACKRKSMNVDRSIASLQDAVLSG